MSENTDTVAPAVARFEAERMARAHVAHDTLVGLQRQCSYQTGVKDGINERNHRASSKGIVGDMATFLSPAYLTLFRPEYLEGFNVGTAVVRQLREEYGVQS